MFFYISYSYTTTGQWPQLLQGQNWLYRQGNYCSQHMANANPDNFWDRRYYCWTSDPACGLDLAPKRPHLDLKDPKKTQRHTMDMNVNAKLVASGFHSL